VDDPFNIPITLYRNAGYSLPLALEKGDGTPFVTPFWTYRLEIAPSAWDYSWPVTASFAQELIAGSGDSGTNFVLSDGDTSALDFTRAYSWRVLARAPGAAPAALCGGPAAVRDGPDMPEINPL
jgi:hypothetical protein